MCKAPRVLLLRGAAAPTVGWPIITCGEVGGVADESSRVEPVVSADGNGHESKGCKRTYSGQQYLNALFAPQTPLFIPTFQ